VGLVPSLPEPEKAVPDINPNRGGSIATLWEGEDLALHTTLLEALESAGIRYFDQPMGVYPGVRSGDPFPIQPMTRFGYQVAVLSSDLVSAERILGRLLEEELQDMELPAQEEKKDETPERTAPREGSANCEIWSGSDEGLAEFLTAALEENGMPTRVERQNHKASIYASPEDETRAREIVREIVEGVPPK
jgi:hypothetical protein